MSESMTEPVASLPRRFALLGPSESSMVAAPWRRAIESSDAHTITIAALAVHPGARTLPDWPSLMDHRAEYDAILVNGDPSELTEAISRLAAEGLPLVIPIDIKLPPELVAELSLFDTEGVARLIPLWSTRSDRLVQQLREVMSTGRLGEIVSIESRIGRQPSSPAMRNVLGGDRTLLAEIDTLRRLGGDYSQVHLIRTGVREDEFAMQTLMLTGPGLPDAVSLLDTTVDQQTFQIRVEGTGATATLQHIGTQGVLKIDGETIAEADQLVSTERMPEMIDEAALGRPGAPIWRDVARAFEIMEAAQRSLRRRRTIDLHFETTSERSQFKTHMATIGCGVILWTMFGMMGLLFAGAVLDPRDASQMQAESAGFVVRAVEFEPGTESLTNSGIAHVQQIATQITQTDAVVIVESVADQTGRPELDAWRQVEVWATLADAGGGDDESRVVVRPLNGDWFLRTMTWGRVLVFGPVGLFLLLQMFLVIAKPPAQG